MTQQATCATCPWWQNPFRETQAEGACRRRAPSLIYLHEHQAYDPRYGVWPVTGQSDWCGEHPERQPKPSQTDPAGER